MEAPLGRSRPSRDLLVMFRTLLMYSLLRRLRDRSPELFDGSRALAAINACIEQDSVELSLGPGISVAGGSVRTPPAS